MVLQAFIDESEGQDGTFAIGGHVASAEAWSKLAAEWEQMLPLAVMGKNGQHHFKMSEMAATAERMARVPGFYRLIEAHVMSSIQVVFNTGALRRAITRVHAPGLNLQFGKMSNPYYFGFRVLFDSFHSRRSEMIKAVPNEKVYFYFDERSEKRYIRDTWDRYIASRPANVRELYGNEPRFESDADFLPLQAADLWLWWVRKWHSEGRAEMMDGIDFGGWTALKGRPIVDISLTEDLIVTELAAIARHNFGPLQQIFDLATDCRL